MKIQSTVKRMALAILVLLLFTPLVLADVIYLKDGSILRGKITEETSESITIEGEGYWTIIKRVDIQKIVREVEKPKEERITIIRKRSNIGNIFGGVTLVFLVILMVWVVINLP